MGSESGKCKCCRRRSRSAISREGGDPSMLPRVPPRKCSARTRKRKIFAREVGDLPPAPYRVSQHSYRIVQTRTRATRSTRATRATRTTRSTRATRATRPTRDTLAIREHADRTTHVARRAAENRRWKSENGKSKMKRPAGPQALWVLDKEKVRQWEVENEVGKWKM